MTNPITETLDALLEQLPSDASKRAYRLDWARYVSWLANEGIAIVDARPRHVVAHMASLQTGGCKKSTIQRALSVIREVYGALVREEVMKTNPAREVKNPKVDSTPKTPYLSEEQSAAVLNLSAKTWHERRDRLCVGLLLGIGWRRAEVARMCVEDFKNGTVTGTIKGNKQLTAGVPEWLQGWIEEWKAFAGIERGPLLPRSPQTRAAVSGDIVYQIVRAATERAGVGKIGPHSLRRTNITYEGERGVSLKIRQLSVGHASSATTERYDKARDAAKNAPGQVFADLIKKSKNSL